MLAKRLQPSRFWSARFQLTREVDALGDQRRPATEVLGCTPRLDPSLSSADPVRRAAVDPFSCYRAGGVFSRIPSSTARAFPAETTLPFCS
jgi:hypothetical protein